MARIRNLPYYAYLRYRIHRLQAQIDANNRLTTHLSTQRGIDEYAYRITLNNTQFNASRDFATWARRDEKLRAGLGGLVQANAAVLGGAEEALLERVEVLRDALWRVQS
jgi:hypothetical protein